VTHSMWTICRMTPCAWASSFELLAVCDAVAASHGCPPAQSVKLSLVDVGRARMSRTDGAGSVR
jgi:hypothetical protein